MWRMAGRATLPASTEPRGRSSRTPTRPLSLIAMLANLTSAEIRDALAARTDVLLVKNARVSHMAGGIDRWSDDVDPAVPKY